MNKQAVFQIVPMAVAGGVFVYLGHSIPGAILCCLASTLVVLGFVAPSVQGTLVELGEHLAKLLVTGFAALLLICLYYTVFLGGSLWLRLRGIDPLNRSLPTHGQSNWVDRVGYGADKAFYGKQFTSPHSQSGSSGPPR